MNTKAENEDLKSIADSLKYLLVLQLFNLNTTQGDIAKKLHLSKSTVNDMLKGVRKGDISLEPIKIRS